MSGYVTPSGQVILLDEDVVLPGRLSMGSHGYAQLTGVEPGVVVLLHRWLLGMRKGDGMIGDHINRNPLDCRRSNLRIVTPSESNMNRVVASRALPLGVYLSKGRFQAKLKRKTKTHHLGTFDTVEEATVARDQFLAA